MEVYGRSIFSKHNHVLETHSEGVYTAGDANADYDIFGDHISRFVHTIGYTSPHIEENRPSQQEIYDILMGRRTDEGAGELPKGMTAREAYAEYVQNNNEGEIQTRFL